MPDRRERSAPPLRRGDLRSAGASVATWLPVRRATRIAFLAGLLLAVTAAFTLINRPGLAIYMYALIPVVLAVHWFRLAGGLTAAAAATLLFVGASLMAPTTTLSGSELWVAAFNRGVVFVGVAALVTMLLQRERELTSTVRAQQDEIAEFESLRAALTPSEVPVRPHLQFATSYTPADGLVAGDFFLVVAGPNETTTVAVGDVVGHGLEAARCAAFVRAGLATFARFTSDPAELLQMANAALVEHDQDCGHFVTALCLNIGAPPARQVSWASAGHDVPWFLDTGAPLPGGRVGAPLGIDAEALKVETGQTTLAPGDGILLFTDGLVEGRAHQRSAAGPPRLFGEDRARRVLRDHRGTPADGILDALVAAVHSFAEGPLADDLCLVAVRAAGPSPA
jgi:serine phosphatase RsbU (regulator of sigma subunit)